MNTRAVLLAVASLLVVGCAHEESPTCRQDHFSQGQTCTPDCTGKVCGDDGCGGSCGSCSLGEGCIAGLCQAVLAFQQDLGPEGLVVLEAESFDATIAGKHHDWLALASTEASGGAAQVALPDDGKVYDTTYDGLSPRLDFTVNFVAAGKHYVWVRGFPVDPGADSCHVGLDGVAASAAFPAFSAERVELFDPATYENPSWKWSNYTMDGVIAAVHVPTGGIHTVNVWMREDGFVVDKIALSTSASFRPVGLGPVESPRAYGAPGCVPDCAASECGDDGCGGSCGTCLNPRHTCSGGACLWSCTPNCTGKQCGFDGCGGSCGVCPAGFACEAGLCAPDPVPSWSDVHQEDFEATALPAAGWTPDTCPDDGPFSDNGVYFQGRGVTPPAAHRATAVFGDQGWLTIEAYTRDPATPTGTLVQVVTDPGDPGNKVLRLASPAHTDATVIRSSAPLPSRYRVSLRVGFPSFGTGVDPNGYDAGTETAEPWAQSSAVNENGFYSLAILDAVPRPHNNVWIHHHRKVVMDSDNNFPAWTEIWNGHRFVTTGVHPMTMLAVAGPSTGTEANGKGFYQYAGGEWHEPGGDYVRAVDAYNEIVWYDVSIERSGGKYHLRLSGDFAYGGQQTYVGEIDFTSRCIFHYNQTPEELDPACEDYGYYPSLGAAYPHWPMGTSYPDYFMFGDPHVNYYEGVVYYDDIRLEVPAP